MNNILNIPVKFKKWDCLLAYSTYADNGRLLLRLVDAETREPIATCTTNLPDINLKRDQVAIKSYSENEGMAPALIRANVLGRHVSTIKTGFVYIPVYELTMDVFVAIRHSDES